MTRRLIEQAFPLHKVSEDSRHEKNVRHGHISTLHIWPARRPLAACRATTFAALIPDPGEADQLPDDGPGPWLTPELRAEYVDLARGSTDPAEQRRALCALIEGFTRWKSESGPQMERARQLIRLAYNDRPPRVMDPFAGGGAIPLEAMRLGCQVTAMDVNPVAWLLLKCTLEYPQRFNGEEWPLPTDKQDTSFSKSQRQLSVGGLPLAGGQLDLGMGQPEEVADLAGHVRYWGNWVLERAREELAPYYPVINGQEPVAYIWSRTVPCPDPRCGTTVPLVKTLWLCKKKGKLRALRMIARPEEKQVDFEVWEPEKAADVGAPTMAKGAKATCPCCGTMLPTDYIRRTGTEKGFGLQLITVVVSGAKGKVYRDVSDLDRLPLSDAAAHGTATAAEIPYGAPDEPMSEKELLCSRSTGGTAFVNLLFGLNTWAKLFTPRQILGMAVFVKWTRAARQAMLEADCTRDQQEAIAAYLSLAIDRLADRSSSIAHWDVTRETIANTYQRFSLPMSWDFSEIPPYSEASGGYPGAVRWIGKVVDHVLVGATTEKPNVVLSSVTQPQKWSVDCVVTDPPYYDAVPYADISDFFYVWLRRTVGDQYPDQFSTPVITKAEELVQHAGRSEGDEKAAKNKYESGMALAFLRMAESLEPDGRTVVVFAHKDPDAWETLVTALISAGFTVTASWPIDTEMKNRVRGQTAAALSTSLWMVCKKRPLDARVGRYKQVQRTMQKRITERLRYFWDQGISGPDFIWAAVGPALESYSSHPEVRRLDGSPFTVGEFLREVRRHVTDFALSKILGGASTEGLDPWTSYTLMHRAHFGMGDAPVGECILLSQGYGLDLDDLRVDRGVLAKGKKGSAMRLRRFDERYRDDLGDPHPSGGLPLVDQLHRLLKHWDTGDTAGLADYMARTGLGQNELFWSVAQATVEMAEAGSRERALLEAVVAWGRGRAPDAPTGQLTLVD